MVPVRPRSGGPHRIAVNFICGATNNKYVHCKHVAATYSGALVSDANADYSIHLVANGMPLKKFDRLLTPNNHLLLPRPWRLQEGFRLMAQYNRHGANTPQIGEEKHAFHFNSHTVLVAATSPV